MKTLVGFFVLAGIIYPLNLTSGQDTTYMIKDI